MSPEPQFIDRKNSEKAYISFYSKILGIIVPKLMKSQNWINPTPNYFLQGNNNINSIKRIGDSILVGGGLATFNSPSGPVLTNPLCYINSSNQLLTNNISTNGGLVYDIIQFQGETYLSGLFNLSGYPNSIGVIKFSNNLNSWVPVGTNYPNNVRRFCIYQNELYVIGLFESLSDNTNAYSIAKWNGTTWVPVGNGIQYPFNVSLKEISDVVVHRNKLYVCGRFTQAGNISVSNIAAWDGSSWSSVNLGTGFDDIVRALYSDNDTLYAGGIFWNIDGNSRVRVAKMVNESKNWLPIGNGVDLNVFDLEKYSGKIFVCGQKSSPGQNGDVLQNIGYFNGTSWIDVSVDPTNPNWVVHVLYWDQIGNKFFAGGYFFGSNPPNFPNYIAVHNQSILSINKINLKTQLLGNTVKLQTDLDISGSSGTFYLERSKNGTNFQTIYSQSVSDQTRILWYEDKNLNPDKYQYRVRVVQDNSTKCSTTVFITVGAKTISVKSDGQRIFLEGNTQNIQLQLFDGKGSKILEKKLGGEQVIEPFIQNSGIYLIRLLKNNEEILSEKVALFN